MNMCSTLLREVAKMACVDLAIAQDIEVVKACVEAFNLVVCLKIDPYCKKLGIEVDPKDPPVTCVEERFLVWGSSKEGLSLIPENFLDEEGRAKMPKISKELSIRIRDDMSELCWMIRKDVLAQSVRSQTSQTIESLAKNGLKIKDLSVPSDPSEKTAHKTIGDMGEYLVAANLVAIDPKLTPIGSIENSSGQGIDILVEDQNTRRIEIIEVKTSHIDTKHKKPPRLKLGKTMAGKQGSENWIRMQAINLMKSYEAKVACEGEHVREQEDYKQAMDIAKRIMSQSKGVGVYTVGVYNDEDSTGELKISYREPGKQEFKLVKKEGGRARTIPFEMDSVIPAEDHQTVVDRNHFPAEFTNYDTNRTADGDD